MNIDVENCIRQNIPWAKLPPNIKQSFADVQKEYEKQIVSYSIKNQLRFRGNLVRQVKKDNGEPKYYEELLAYSQTNLLLYPYHLSDVIVRGLRVTPFQYYSSILKSIMEQERSYDSLPNFTAADCLRLLGIGRNEYIDLMNQCRSGQKLFRRKNVKDLLPLQPVNITMEPWWFVDVGYIVDADMKIVTQPEKEIIDKIIDNGPQKAGDLDCNVLLSVYKKGLVYLQLPIEDSDHIVVPPLEGFVMNRVSGDNFENLLYKIFVSTDEHTSVGELANVLRMDSQSVKNAVSLYCRLGFAKKKMQDAENPVWHSSWRSPVRARNSLSPSTEDPLILELNEALAETSLQEEPSPTTQTDVEDDSSAAKNKRTAFLFDSTLTAFLMMGNLSSGLKSHAVTMFEVGKLSDELIDSFLCELEKVSSTRDDSEGEVRRYFEHALILRSTVMRLRHVNAGLDLVRCESLQSLDNDTCARLLEKNYGLLVTMAPLSKEVRPIVTHQPPHLGPPTQDVNSIWFKLYLYHITGSGPSSILFTRGTRVRKLPKVLKSCERVLVTLWGHDPTVIPLANLIFALNDALFHSPVLVQAYGSSKGADVHMLPFPFMDDSKDSTRWCSHPAVDKVSKLLDLKHTCGYLTMVRLKRTARPGTLPPPLWGVAKVESANDKVRQFLESTDDKVGRFLESTDDKVGRFLVSTDDKVGRLLESDDDKVGQFLNTSDLSPQPSTSPSSISDATWVHRPPGNESPVNGITDKESAHILEEELDGLTEAGACGSSKNSPCRESVETKDVKSSWTEIGNCAADKRRDDNIGELSDWLLLECLFGVPLFEAEINEKICDTIVNRLADKASLEQLVISNQKLGKNLEEFIVQFQDLNKICTPQMFSPSQSSVPWPATNLMFVNGELKEWDKK